MPGCSEDSVSGSLGRLAIPFWARVRVRDSGCWEFEAPSGSNNGYARIGRLGRRWLAHRYAWWLYEGEEAEGECLHSCDNERCVSPFHLSSGTHADNMADAASKGRCRSRGAWTTCPQGHDDWYIRASGKRRCRTCQKQYEQAVRAEQTEYQRARRSALRALKASGT